MQSLAVRVLGDFGVEGVEQRTLGSRKARLLLRLLAMARGRPVPVDVLAEALWGNAPPARPADQVAVLVSRLRVVLGRERLEHGDGGYRLHYDWLDADELADLLEEVERRRADGNVVGAAVAARAALSLLRGDLTGRGLTEDWSQNQFAELQRLVIRTRRVAALALLAAGYGTDAADLSSALLADDPYDEDAVRCLMRAYAAAGRGGSALAAYADLRRRLDDELGTDPAPETAAVHEAVLRGELVADAGPATSEPLVGRDHQLARLDELAARAHGGAPLIVTIEGEAGIGKTSVLRAWGAHRAARGDLVLHAECRPLDRSVPLDAVLVAVLAALRNADPDQSRGILGADAELLQPMIGSARATHVAPLLADGAIGLPVLFAALVRVLQRLAGLAPLVLLVDDAHLAGPALGQWLEYLARREVPVVVAAARRAGEGDPLPARTTLRLGPLDRAAAAELVGNDRVDELYALSHGHPLFLTQLATSTESGELPASLVQAVAALGDGLGTAGVMLRAAAVIGPNIDLDLLASVLRRPVLDLLDDAEAALARQLLVDDRGVFRFRHELVRAALAAGTPAGRAALLHREAGRVLAGRPDADPVEVAEQARLGGDLVLAARSLRTGAARAAQRFDHATAERLLDEALRLEADADGWLQRARIRTLRGSYAAALSDVERASAAGAGAAALEVGAWASYFDRRFEAAVQPAEDGAIAAADPDVRARCLTVGGRTRHAAGDLAGAERMLGGALDLARGADRVTASAWLGVLRAHQSQVPEALQLLGPAARSFGGVEHTSATLHALLFTGHAHAVAAQPVLALDSFARYTDEVERRQVLRFAGRGVNFAGWVLRNLGAAAEAVDHHQEALDVAVRHGTAEVFIAAHSDLAEDALLRGDLDAAAAHLATAEAKLRGDLVFGWRLAMKRLSLRARLALRAGAAEQAHELATELGRRADAIAVPRYGAVARLLAAQACVALGEPADHGAVVRELDVLDRCVGIEAWWMTGEVAAQLRVPGWVDRAATRVTALASVSGPYADGLRASAGPRLARWASTAAGVRRR